MHTQATARRSAIVRLIVLGCAVGLLVVAVGAPAGHGADPFVAGGPSTRPVGVGQAGLQRAVAKAQAVNRALGLPGVRQTVSRLDDRLEHLVYDEVTSYDAAGRATAMSRFTPDGALLSSLRLTWHAPIARRAVNDSAAAARAVGFAMAAGFPVQGTPVVRPSAGAGGWSVSWPRLVDGVPVRGDGVRVAVWSDGTFHAIHRSERPLAAVPARRIEVAAARGLAAKLVAARYGPFDRRELRVAPVEPAWVAPNDTWQPARPDAPAAVMRLAWVVRFEATGKLAERVRMLEYWLDAGSGALIGGDVVE